jgi:hypothetical protein
MERLAYILIIFILGIAYTGSAAERAYDDGYEQGYEDALYEENVYACGVFT